MTSAEIITHTNPTVTMRYPYPFRLISVCLLSILFLGHSRGSPGIDPEEALPVFSCGLSFPQGIFLNPNTIYVPFKMVGRLIAVEAQVDTVSGIFVLDTGAERLLLNKNYFGWDHRIKDVAAFGSTGPMGPVLFKKVDTLQWDNLYFFDVKANVVDLSHLEAQKNIRLVGMIGYEVLKDFEVFLDFQTMTIVITRLDENGFRIDQDAIPELPYDSLGFMMRRHLIILDATVDGARLKFTLDSGAELNLLDRLVSRKVLDHFQVLKRVNMRGVGQNSVEVLAGKLYDVVCGNQTNEAMGTLLTSLEDMNNEFHTRLDGVIGMEFLFPRRTLINYKQKKLFFYKNNNKP